MKNDINSSNFKILSKKEESKLSKEEQIKYYKKLRDYYQENRWIENISDERRNSLHKYFVPLFKLNSNILHMQNIKVLEPGYKEKGKNTTTKIDSSRPVIYVINHVGKYDVETVGQTVSEPFSLLSGDFENLHDTFDGNMLGIHGVIYYDMNVKEEAKEVKERLINHLSNGNNVMWCIEQTWNFSPNKLVLDSKYGIIDVAKITNAQIVPIGIIQYDRKLLGSRFIIKQGNIFDVNDYYDKYDELTAKKEGIKDLRDNLATLMWYIMEYDFNTYGPEDRNELVNSDYWATYIYNRIKEWKFTYEEVMSKRFFDPSVIREEDVYAFLENINIDKNNAFLLKNDKNKKVFEKKMLIKKYSKK